MNRPLQADIEALFEMFNQKKLKALAFSTGFMVRERNFSASQFIRFLFRQHRHLIDHSLESLCLELDEQEVQMTKSSLNKRLNWKTVTFLQALTTELFALHVAKNLPTIHPYTFSMIRILDSSIITLPDSYQPYFNGLHHSTVKIHIEIDFLTQQLLHYQLGNGRDADNPAGWERLEKIHENELILQDLGYFQYDLFEAIDQKGAFYITKAKKDVPIYVEVDNPPVHPNGVKIEAYRYTRLDLDVEVKQMARGTYKEWPFAYAGRHKKLPVRCIIYRQTEEQEKETIARERRRRQTKQGQVHKKPLDEVLGMTIYLTNVGEDVRVEEIHEFYRLRWQIELLFKTWKSDLNVASVKPVKIERWLCHLYVQLIILFISQKVSGYIKQTLRETIQCIISERKTVREVAKQVNRLLDDFWKAKSQFDQALHQLTQRIRSHCQKSVKRQTRRTS